MSNSYGYAGNILKIDLTEGKVLKEPLSSELIENYVGGIGIDVKLAHDLVGSDVDSLSPESSIFIGAGPLIGTLAPGVVHSNIIVPSPINNYLSDGRTGEFGQWLKYAGYDHLVITGKADKPAYITIFDDEVKFQEANDLWGKTVHETIRSLQGKYGTDCTFCCIGPAGENLVKFAGNLTDKIYSFGATNGAGAVMGSKNLKAIVVKGTKGIGIKDPDRFMQIVDKARKQMADNPFIEEWQEKGTIFDLGYYAGFGCFTAKNGREGYSEEKAEEWVTELLSRRRGNACIGCPVGCKGILDYSGSSKYPGLCFYKSAPIGVPIAFGWWPGVEDYEDVAMLTNLNDAYGLDMFGASHVISLAIELFEVGVINEKDTDGMVLNWDFETVKKLLRKIAYREGFGSVLAEGSEKACEIIGRGAEKYDCSVKGFPQLEDGRAKHMGTTTFGEITSPSGAAFRAISITQVPGRSPGALRRYGARIGMSEEKIDQIFTGKMDGYNTARFTKWVEDYITLLECFGVCHRSIIAASYPLDVLSELLSAATGVELGPEELVKVGERVWNLEKCFDVQRGQSIKDDRYPERWYREPLKLNQLDPEKRSMEKLRGAPKIEQLDPLVKEEVEKGLQDYYDERGWEPKKGVPTKEKLLELGLDIKGV